MVSRILLMGMARKANDLSKTYQHDVVGSSGKEAGLVDMDNVGVEARLDGYFGPTFVIPDNRRVAIYTDRLSPGALDPSSTPFVSITNARCVQAQAKNSASFFDQHGFVLLKHATAVNQWNTDYAKPSGEDNDVARIYAHEIEQIIRDVLLPDCQHLSINAPAAVLRRGPGTENPFYAEGVHNDYGLSPDDYQETLQAFGYETGADEWRRRVDRSDVRGFMVINFWRSVDTEHPVEHKPLGVCDPHTIEKEDIVPAALLNFAPTGKPTNQLALKYNENQRWYYYPRMTADEVLVFKNFVFFETDDTVSLQSCYHSAFEDPTTPSDSVSRQSCEYRVSVFFH